MSVPPGILKRWDQEGPGQQATSVDVGEWLRVGQVTSVSSWSLSSPVSPPPPPPSAAALLQLPPSCNQSLRVASEPGGGGQVNSGAPGGRGSPGSFITEPRSSSRSPGRSPQAWPGFGCVLGTPVCVQHSRNFPFLSLKRKFIAVEVVRCSHPKLRG